MGNSNWSSDSYARFASDFKSKSTDDIFGQNKSRTISNDLSPEGVLIRESRDSVLHPNSVAISVWLDVTGSMGKIPEIMIREKLNKLMETLISNGVADAHVLFGAIGDHYTDSYPLQVSQYEAGTEELVKWLTSIYIEGGGGGQTMESYLLAWMFAARHTAIDCFEKRNKKGFIFTIGDESTHTSLSGAKIKSIMGVAEAEDVSAEQLLIEASEKYEIFHIHINEGNYRNSERVLKPWRDLLGERLIILNDYNNIAELIASTVAIMHGASLQDVTANFDTNVATTIQTALVDVEKFAQHTDDEILEL